MSCCGCVCVQLPSSLPASCCKQPVADKQAPLLLLLPAQSFALLVLTKPIDSNLWYCLSCSDGGELLCCDGCPAAYHTTCLGNQVPPQPNSEWLCGECGLVSSSSSGAAGAGMRMACDVCDCLLLHVWKACMFLCLQLPASECCAACVAGQHVVHLVRTCSRADAPAGVAGIDPRSPCFACVPYVRLCLFVDDNVLICACAAPACCSLGASRAGRRGAPPAASHPLLAQQAWACAAAAAAQAAPGACAAASATAVACSSSR
jgi:hypothetical protein